MQRKLSLLGPLSIVTLLFSLLGGLAQPVQAQSGLQMAVQYINAELFPQVEAYVSVSTQQGLPLSQLKAENFKLYEDGQIVESFEFSPTLNVQQPLSFVLAVDTSGSMNQNKGLQNSVAAAKTFIESLSAQDKVAVVSFSDEVIIEQELTSEKSLALEALEGLELSNNTRIYDALVQSVELLKDEGNRKVIILITDGTDSGPGVSTYTLDNAINEAVRWSVPVYPIGFGNVHSGNLEQIASLSGGFAQISPDSSSLSDSFDTISQLLREQYLLRFNSALDADGAEHTLQVQLDYEDWHEEAENTFTAVYGEVLVSMPDFEAEEAVSGKLVFEPQVNAPGEIERIEIQMDGTLLGEVLAAPFLYEWDSSAAAVGLHEFTFIVTDTAGNSGETSLTLDVRPALQISIDQPQEGQTLTVSTTVEGQVNSMAKLAKVELYLDDKPIGSTESELFNFELSFEGVEAGEHTLLIKALDANGMEGSQTVNILVRRPVTVEIQSPLEGESLKTAHNEITAAVDSFYEVSQVSFQVDGETLDTADHAAESYTFTWTIYDVDPGTHVISVLVEDAKGNSEIASVNVDVAAGGGNTDGRGFGGAAFVIIGVAAVFLVIFVLIKRKKKTDGPQGAGGEKAALILRELEGLNPNQVWPLNMPEIRLGRKKTENDIPLLGANASRRHALIREYQGAYILYSLNPDNPVLVNNIPVVQQHSLRDGDVVRLGETVLRCEFIKAERKA